MSVIYTYEKYWTLVQGYNRNRDTGCFTALQLLACEASKAGLRAAQFVQQNQIAGENSGCKA